MKTALAMVVLLLGGFVAVNYVSNYAMGGIEAGLPGGGHGRYADYHEDNLFSYWLSDYDEEYRPSFFSEEDGDAVVGQATSNPFVVSDSSSK